MPYLEPTTVFISFFCNHYRTLLFKKLSTRRTNIANTSSSIAVYYPIKYFLIYFHLKNNIVLIHTKTIQQFFFLHSSLGNMHILYDGV